MTLMYSIVLLAQHSELIEPCLAALHSHTQENVELIVVNDGNQLNIQQTLVHFSNTSPFHIRELSTSALSGIAEGYNLGANMATCDRIILMRDLVTVTPGWLEGLSRCLDDHPNIAFAGPLSYGVTGPQQLEMPVHALYKLPLEYRLSIMSPYERIEQTHRLLSFLLMIRKEAFIRLGGFDIQYELESYEDDDLSLRALRAGYKLAIARDIAVEYKPLFLFPEWTDRYNRQLVINRQRANTKWGEDVTGLLMKETRKITISLCMIVKNEEATLNRCLASIAPLVDEIIIIDTGSTDATKAIAEKYTSRIFDFEWINDFAAARNFAFEKATQEYILWLDADDILLPKDQELFHKLIRSLPYHTDVVSMHYHLHRDRDNNVTSSLRRNRLVRRSKGYRWIGLVHEYLATSGSTLYSDIAITHDRVHQLSNRNLKLYEAHLNNNGTLGPRDLYYYSNELYDHSRFEEAVTQYEKFLNIPGVWIEDRIGACGKASECYFQLKRYQESRQKALQSFSYALPRAENCCRIGQSYMAEELYQEAIFWYQMATKLQMPSNSGGLLLHAYWTWLPHLQLCVCYDRIGQYREAYEANEQAALYIPNDQRIIANRSYLLTKLNKDV